MYVRDIEVKFAIFPRYIQDILKTHLKYIDYIFKIYLRYILSSSYFSKS